MPPLVDKDYRWLRRAILGVAWQAAPARFRKLYNRGLISLRSAGVGPIFADITPAGRAELRRHEAGGL